MAKFNWQIIAKDLLAAIGGKKNLKSFQNCATRFRFYVKNNKLVSKAKLNKIDLVKGINKEDDQWQVIFGAGTVNKVHDAFKLLVGGSVSKKEATSKKESLWNNNVSFASNSFTIMRKGIRSFADIFIPLIPVFIAGGLSLALSSLIGNIDKTSEAAKASKAWFELIGGGILGSLPAFVGYTAMKKFGGTPMLGLAIGIILVAPSLLNGWVSSSNYVYHSFSADGGSINTLKNQYVINHSGWIIDLMKGDFKDVDASKNMVLNLFKQVNAHEWSGWSTLKTNIENAKTITELKTAIGSHITFISGAVNASSAISIDIAMVPNIAVSGGWTQISQSISINEFASINGMTINAVPALLPKAPSFFAMSFVGYQAQVFPTLGIIALAYWIERLMKKVSHESIAIISVPLVTVVLSLLLGFFIIGPVGRYVGFGISEGFQNIYKYTNWPWFGFGGSLIGAAYPFLVVTGLHQGFIPIEASLIAETSSTFGHSFTWITAVGSVSNVAQGMVGLTLAVMLWKKAPKASSTAITGSISANLGITEPILFGVNLPIRYGMFASASASAIGGYYVGMTHTVANSMGSASWLGLVQFDFKTGPEFWKYITYYGFNTTPGLSKLPPVVNEIIALSITTIAAILFTILYSKTFGKKAHQEFIEANTEKRKGIVNY